MIDYNEFEEYLAHYGVGHLRGGHSGRYPWGSSNNSKGSASGTSEEGNKKWSTKLTKQEALEGGSAADVLAYQGKLTNKELQDAVTRLRLEEQLKDINDREIHKGRSAAKKVLSAIGNKVAIPLAVGATGIALRIIIEKKFGTQIDEFLNTLPSAQVSPNTKSKLDEFIKELFKGVNPPPKK